MRAMVNRQVQLSRSLYGSSRAGSDLLAGCRHWWPHSASSSSIGRRWSLLFSAQIERWLLHLISASFKGLDDSFCLWTDRASTSQIVAEQFCLPQLIGLTCTQLLKNSLGCFSLPLPAICGATSSPACHLLWRYIYFSLFGKGYLNFYLHELSLVRKKTFGNRSHLRIRVDGFWTVASLR